MKWRLQKTDYTICTINGERNSGTNFLNILLRKHRIPTYDGLCMGKLSFSWRHGYPSRSLKLLSYGRVINFLIFRNLDEWLISMYNNPYYLKHDRSETSFEEFLTKKQELSGKADVPINQINKKVLNHTDEGKTIFEIRYQKIRKYLRFYKKNENVVIVNLAYLQNEENCLTFLKAINEKYGFNIARFEPYVNDHTKTAVRNQKNRAWGVHIPDEIRTIIDTHKNKKLERRIRRLTFKMK